MFTPLDANSPHAVAVGLAVGLGASAIGEGAFLCDAAQRTNDGQASGIFLASILLAIRDVRPFGSDWPCFSKIDSVDLCSSAMSCTLLNMR